MEYRLAAVWANYTWEGFCALDGYQQSDIVALYRISHMMEAVANDDAQKEMKRKSAQRQ